LFIHARLDLRGGPAKTDMFLFDAQVIVEYVVASGVKDFWLQR
jgi:hypothetical protein